MEHRKRVTDNEQIWNADVKNDRVANDKLRSGLGWRKLKAAFKTVFLNFKEYASFFAALFIIQSMIWLLCFTTATNIVREREMIEKTYDHHVIVDNLTKSDVSWLENAFAIKDAQIMRSYEEYRFIEPDENNKYYSLRVRLKQGSDIETFVQYYLEGNSIDTSRLEITPTPLITYDNEYVGTNINDAILAGILLIALSVVVMMSLFNIRLNHYKFMYGIYMTCGAGFRRLFSSSIWEMMVIACSTVVLSGVTSFALCAVVFSTVEVAVMWWMIPLVLVLNFIIVFLAVYMPTKALSIKTPLSLIVAQDNSNLVSSPKRSFKIFNKSFPYHYELFSAWRFRKYFVRTLITSILFTSLFLCTVYVGYMKKTDEAVMGPELIAYVDIGDVDVTGTDDVFFNINDVIEVMCEIQSEALETLDGVRYTKWVNETSASSLNSHLLLGLDTTGGYKYAVSAPGLQAGYNRATNVYDYTAMDKHYIDTLCAIYEVDGDPYAVLSDSSKIIISDKMYNGAGIAFEVGDRVLAATFFHGKLDQTDYLTLSPNEILKKQLEKCTYEYKEYEIAAVVHGGENVDSFMVGMNYIEYYAFTGNTKVRGDIKIFTEQGLDSTMSEPLLNEVRGKLNEHAGIYGMNYRIQRNFRILNDELIFARHTYLRIIIIAVLLLMLSPVVWFFSQLLFYFKREKEINILRMFGASDRQVRGLYSFAGLIMSACATVVTVLLGYLASFGLYKLFNNILVKYGFVSGTEYEFYISIPALITSIVLSVLCGFLSSFIPYAVSKRRIEKQAARQLSQDN